MTDRHRPHTLLVMGDHAFRSGFDDLRLNRLRQLTAAGNPIHAAAFTAPDVRERLPDIEVLMTGWGAPPVDNSVLDAAPHLRAVLHTAGSVKSIVQPVCWERGLRVTTAAEANAVPVAEYTLAAILFAGKRIIQSAHQYRQLRRHTRPAGLISNFQRTVGIIGYSRIGRRVVNLLRPFDFDILVADPYADAAQIRAAGASHVDLDDLLRRSAIVSIHAPALPTTRHLLNKERLALIPDDATIINTARGMVIDTTALEAECASDRLSAILDVTDPEPLGANSPLWDLPNVFITPHMAGAQQTEIHRLVDTALDELERYTQDLPPLHGITAADLGRIA
ncbi:hydroxyacid dehydrogenase [Phytoactinopolyspora limicola]|uniref:hydroxyacid dehydrogenase n=1 Tax=Phytoactinopolyspora limicola TaxID=2715536 RepID=UPI00140D8F4A|nr:hydroxyacid dehydrogenase [Phytoactinopolyspora limicola]